MRRHKSIHTSSVHCSVRTGRAKPLLRGKFKSVKEASGSDCAIQ